MEDLAYQRACALWSDFDREVDGTLLRAVAGAFALIACADGHLADAEVERFLTLVEGQDALKSVSVEDLEQRFRKLSATFTAEYDLGERKATELVAAVRHDPEAVELVIRAAQIAIVADERLEPVEEVALTRLCRALEVDPSGY